MGWRRELDWDGEGRKPPSKMRERDLVGQWKEPTPYLSNSDSVLNSWFLWEKKFSIVHIPHLLPDLGFQGNRKPQPPP